MATPTRSRDDGKASASLLSILSLNCFKLPDMAGLPALLRENRPHFIFLQEVGPTAQLSGLASASGYFVHKSTCDSPRRTMAVLSREQGVRVTYLEAGYMQFIQWGSLSFVHVHLPSGPIEQPAREAMLRRLRHPLRLAVPPILVGDFNVVLHPMDTEDRDFRKHHKFSQALEAIVSELSYVDAFRVLFPCTIAFSWHRRGHLAARLDRVYLPPLLESRPRVARYIATTSDHHAFLLRLELAGVATLPTPDAAAGRSRSLYWKLNTAVLDDPAFRPAFEDA
jgi:exonuclease III